MHYTVFEQLDTFSFAFLVCKILYIDGKQFRCSVLTFVQYTIFFSRDAKGSSGIWILLATPQSYSISVSIEKHAVPNLFSYPAPCLQKDNISAAQ